MEHFHRLFHSQSNHYSNTHKKVTKHSKFYSILKNTPKMHITILMYWCNLCKVSTRIIQGTCLVQKVNYESDFNAPWQIQILPYVLISRRNSVALTSLGKIVSHGNLSFMINNKRSAETNILFIFNNKLLNKALKSLLLFIIKLTVYLMYNYVEAGIWCNSEHLLTQGK